MRSVQSRVKELEVSHHDRGRHASPARGRVVANFERSPMRPPMGHQSVSLVVTGAEGQTPRPLPGQTSIPNTAPPDLSSFMFNSRSTTDIPQITCRTHTTNNNGNVAAPNPHTNHHTNPHPNHHPSHPPYLSSVSEHTENRRQVKVINVNSGHGSYSGGYVKPGPAAPSESRHFRIHCGDSGGVVTFPAAPGGHGGHMMRSESTPNISHRSQFTTEVNQVNRGDQPTVNLNHHHQQQQQQPALHSSSIVLNNVNSFSPGRKTNTIARDVNVGEKPSTLHLNMSGGGAVSGDFTSQSSFISGKPLSKPIQASSPGISSKPIFVEVRQDSGNMFNFNPNARQPPQPAHPMSSMSGYPAASHPNMTYAPAGTANYTTQYSSGQPSDHFTHHHHSNPNLFMHSFSTPPVSQYPGYDSATGYNPVMAHAGQQGYHPPQPMQPNSAESHLRNQNPLHFSPGYNPAFHPAFPHHPHVGHRSGSQSDSDHSVGSTSDLCPPPRLGLYGGVEGQPGVAGVTTADTNPSFFPRHFFKF